MFLFPVGCNQLVCILEWDRGHEEAGRFWASQSGNMLLWLLLNAMALIRFLAASAHPGFTTTNGRHLLKLHVYALLVILKCRGAWQTGHWVLTCTCWACPTFRRGPLSFDRGQASCRSTPRDSPIVSAELLGFGARETDVVGHSKTQQKVFV